jgi:uncharacterized membrane protein
MPNPTVSHSGFKSDASTVWTSKLWACLAYLSLGSVSYDVGHAPVMAFLLYALGYWVVVQPRRYKFSGFLRFHLLQALFAFAVFSLACHGLILVLDVLTQLIALFGFGAIVTTLVFPWFALLGQVACMALAVFCVVQCVKGQRHQLPWVGTWAERLF